MYYNKKYLKYKNKYLSLKNKLQKGGAVVDDEHNVIVEDECPDCRHEINVVVDFENVRRIIGCKCYKLFRVCIGKIRDLPDGALSYQLMASNSKFLSKYNRNFDPYNSQQGCRKCRTYCGNSYDVLQTSIGLGWCNSKKSPAQQDVRINIRMDANWRKLLLVEDNDFIPYFEQKAKRVEVGCVLTERSALPEDITKLIQGYV